MVLNYPRSTCVYKLGGTETLRASSSAFLDIFGTNMQNISDEMRRMFWADEGYKLVQVDQSGAEALIVAYLCEKGRFRDLFLHGVKPHVFVAMNMFVDQWKLRCKDINLDDFVNTPIPELKNKAGWKQLDTLIRDSDKWSAQERYYYIAKMVCHSSNYSIRGNAFRLNVLDKSKGKIVLTKEQADKYLLSYHTMFPEIHRWHRAVEYQLRGTGMLFNLQGFPRINTGPLVEDDFKEWYAFIPQSTVGVITHIAVTKLQSFITANKLDWHLLNNCHDSYLCEVPESDTKTCAEKMKEFIEQDLVSPRGEKFKMKSEASVGDNWGKYKTDKNPQGMKEI